MKLYCFKVGKYVALLLAGLFIQHGVLFSQCSCGTTVGSNVGIPTLTLAPASVQNITNGCIMVDGSFQVDSGIWTLTDSDVFFASAGSSISVNAGCGINATQSSTFSACVGEWSSIILSGGSTSVFDHCTFSGFNIALTIVGNATFSVTENTFNAVNTNTCIRITGNQTPANHTISGNQFNTAKIGIAVNGNNVTIGPNNYAGSGTIGSVLNMTGVDVSENISNVNVSGGFFITLDKGVNIKKLSRNIFVTGIIFSGNTGVFSQQGLGNLTVHNSSIRATLTGIQINDHQTSGSTTSPANISIASNTITSNTQSGIRITQTYGNGRIDITGNLIRPENVPNSFAHYGIGISTVSSPDAFVRVEGNNIQHGGYGNQNPAAPGGIYLQSCKGRSVIRNNNIYAQYAGGLTFGITVAASPSCQVVGNSINSAGVNSGVPTNIMQRGISMENNQNNILLCCNTINHAERGLNMAGNMENCHIFNTVFDTLPVALYYDQIMTSSAPQFHRGNNWSNSTTTWDAYFNGNYLIAQSAKYRVDPSLMPSLLSKVFVTGGNASDWFSNPVATEAVCANAVDSYCGTTPFEGMVFTSSNETISGIDIWAAQALDNADYAVVHWEAKRYLYQKLQDNPGLVTQNSTISAFYNDALNNNTGKLAAIESGLAHRYDDPDLIEQVISDLIAQNAVIVPDNDVQSNEKNIIAILLNALAAESWDFSSTDKATIDYVASLCPLSGGRAVYTARWLQEYYRVPDWSGQCGTLEQRLISASTMEVSGSMILFPNPTQESVHVVFEGGFPADGLLVVTNFTGQTVERQAVKAGTVEVLLNTAHYVNGCYFVQIQSDQRSTIYQQKLIIAR
jgi:hypothetical protein